MTLLSPLEPVVGAQVLPPAGLVNTNEEELSVPSQTSERCTDKGHSLPGLQLLASMQSAQVPGADSWACWVRQGGFVVSCVSLVSCFDASFGSLS